MAENPSIHDPLSRDGVERLVADCSLLLDYLSRVPDSRLDWCFDETRGRAGGSPPPRIAAPPELTKTKTEFLEALMALSAQVRGAAFGEPPLDPRQLALLLTSRDFLSAIAWPATVETIRVTQAYCAERQRMRVPGWRRLLARLKAGVSPGPAPEEDRAEFYGRRIARRRDRYQVALVVLVALTVWLSYETLVGQRLIIEGQRFAQAWSKHDEALQKASRDSLSLVGSLFITEPSRESQPGYQRYCDYVMRVTTNPGAVGGGRPRLVADNSAGANAPPSGPVSSADARDFFLNFDHQRLCDEHAALRSQGASLENVFSRWYGDISPVVGLLRLPGHAYGDLQAGTCSVRGWVAAHWRRLWGRDPVPGDACAEEPGAHHPIAVAAVDALPPTNAFYEWSIGTEVVTGGMLAQLLPCLYAMLGALASMFRRLGQRVQAESLSIADHGAMRMTLILGVLAGAVIGLFVGEVPTGEKGSTLTLAGLAMLAGYAVDRLFNLFDGLSVRLFGEAATEPLRPH